MTAHRCCNDRFHRILVGLVLVTSSHYYWRHGGSRANAWTSSSSSTTIRMRQNSFGQPYRRRQAFACFGTRTNRASNSINHEQRQHSDDSTRNTAGVTAEVVGAAGRIGSMFLLSLSSNTTIARAVPKGVAPGCLSPPHTPIYVATPAKAWPQIMEDTLPERREDLVWIGNGLPPTTTTTTICDGGGGTVVVPHFGVLQVQADPVTSFVSPPTFVYGKHAALVERILKDNGIHKVETVDTYQEIIVAAAQKLLWAASMWLLCHSTNDDDSNDTTGPLTALAVHTSLKDKLDALVRQELFPALCNRLPEAFTNTPEQCNAALEYMHRYSKSMPTAIPNRDLGRDEWKERNAFFLQADNNSNNITQQQPLHVDLLQRVGGISIEDIIISAMSPTKNSRTGTAAMYATTPRQRINLPELGITVTGSLDPSRTKPIQKAIVVGAGILGSSVALHLARQGIVSDVTVIDVQSSKQLGVTTPASWAWLNANGKSPPEYAWMNQLGMDGWKMDPLLSNLPTWNGSLVRFVESQTMLGGYRYEGPLTEERLQELEPAANFKDESALSDDFRDSITTSPRTYTYYYPDEGLVDPSKAVETVRRGASDLGVQYLDSCNVTAFIKENEDGPVSGLSILDKSGTPLTLSADTIILAAGTGSARLANIPLLHRPGQIAFALPDNKTQGPLLQRIVVDTVRESHILQRECGTIVVGGGQLEVGGSSRGALATNGANQESLDNTLLQTAREVVPGVIGELSGIEQAVRPIPFDGLPVCGFVQPGLYSVVSHSGMTLAPILASLAASEVSQKVNIDTLDLFRPSRFFQKS